MRRSSKRWPSACRRISRPIGAASRITTQSIWNRRTSRQTLRCRSVKKSGEKCQIASLGQISRRPPPAKPQPTANGSAIHSPATTRRDARPSTPTMAPAYGPGEQAGEERAGEGQVGGVVVEEQPRDDPGRQRQAEAGGEDQPLRPVALLGQQDPPEPREPHQHGRQHGHDRELDHQRREQELIGGEQLGFVRHAGRWANS